MYKSPITECVSDVQHDIVKAKEDELMVTITQTIGYAVDKEELIKALQYDRDQYDKGYKDGYSAGIKYAMEHTELE